MSGRTVKQPINGEVHKRRDCLVVSFPKPGELIEIRGASHLTLADSRIWNLLMVHAWKRIDMTVEHAIPKALLRGEHNGNERLSDTIDRLMTTLVEVTVMREGKPARRKVQLLGPTDEHRDESGLLYYRFLPELIDIISQSDHWARLQAQVMFALSSKYSMALYEMVQKRAGLKSKRSEDFTLDELRTFLRVPDGKLVRWPDLRRYCLEPAVAEVAALSDCHVRIDPIKQGKAVTQVRLSWFPKDEAGLKAAFKELQRHRVGRKARISGTVETVAGDDQILL
jgi:hypothetical protein